MRKHLRIARQNIENREPKDNIIWDKLYSVLRKFEHNSVFCYVAIDGEVSTQSIINYCLTHNINLYIPIIIDNQMYPMQVHDKQAVKYYSINEVIIAPQHSKIDITIVPLIGADSNNNRLGWGGGYYDKYLHNNQTLSIGLAYDEQMVAKIPISTHDMQLDIIVTPSETYRI